MKLKRSQNPGGHKEGRASFPIQSQYKVSKIHGSNPTLEKREWKNRKGERKRRTGGKGAAPGLGEREERVGERIFMPTNSITKRLNYP